MSRSCMKTPSCHVVTNQCHFKKLFNWRLRRIVPIDEEQGVSSIPDVCVSRRASESWGVDD